MTLEIYLRDRYSESTIKVYHRDIDHYLTARPKAESANYAQVLSYLEIHRTTQSTASIHRILQSIKKYYNYLIATKKRADHPCELLKLKDHCRSEVQLQDLFKSTELELLLERKERYQILRNRNYLLLSLLIYQGLSAGEIIRLTISSLDLENGFVIISKSHRLNARTLALKSNQILRAYQYLNEDRNQLIKIESDQLFITKKGTAESGEGISYLVSTMRNKFLNRSINPKIIRQSVIANRLAKGEDLRKVQLFAGHKYPSSTERYRATNLDELKAAISKFHPLR